MREAAVPTPRSYPRYPSTASVQIQVAHAWEGGSRLSIPGTLLNVSRGGAGVAISWVLPPRTLLTLLFPEAPELRLPAEIVWTSMAPESSPASAIYGVRWMTHIPRHWLATMVPGHGVSGGPEESSPPRT
jgi:hypothetical protein